MIEIKGISKAFGKNQIIDDVYFNLNDGEKIILSGQSGCGKTTFLKLISGLLEPDSGEIYIDGKLVSSPNFSLHPSERKIGFVFQSPALWPHMTVEKNILFGISQLEKNEREKRLNNILEMTELNNLKDRFPHQLSGGQQKRVSLARTIAVYPKHILLDEPLTNLDSEARDKMLEVIKRVNDTTKTSMIYVTHQVQESQSIADSVVNMVNGRIII